MTKEKQLRVLGMAASDIRIVLTEFDPQSKIHQALSVAKEQVEWVTSLLEREDYPPATMQVEFQRTALFVHDRKTLSTGDKDL